MNVEDIRVMRELLLHAATRVVEDGGDDCDCALAYLEGVLITALAVAHPKDIGSPGKIQIPAKLFGLIPIHRLETRKEYAVRKSYELLVWLKDRM